MVASRLAPYWAFFDFEPVRRQEEWIALAATRRRDGN